jgi:hypothetical protein
MSKTINIEPGLFNFSPKGIRKSKKSKSANNDITPNIRVKPLIQAKDNKTVKKSILKFIRNQQNQNYQRLIRGESPKINPVSSSEILSTEINDFEESMKYLEGLSKEVNTTKQPSHNSTNNRTLKNNPSFESQYIHGNNNMVTSTNNIQNTYGTIPKIATTSSPSYGCIKGGLLPTYRQYMKTIKNLPEKYTTPLNTPTLTPSYITGSINTKIPDDEWLASNDSTNVSADKAIELLQFKRLSANIHKSKLMKQKTTRRRTFRVGKSKVHPKIAVLVSNRTIRNKISTEAQLLKQTPIQDVKRYLIKHGLIKVGGTTPNDVLRQIYETTNMICGEIKNHNPETVLYNFLNCEDIPGI